VAEDRDPCLRCGDLLTDEEARIPRVELCRRCVDDTVVLKFDASPPLVLGAAVGSGLLFGLGSYVLLGLWPGIAIGIAVMLTVGIPVVVLLERRLARLRLQLDDSHIDGLPPAPEAELRGPGIFGGSDHGFLLLGDGYVFLGVRGTRLAIDAGSIQAVSLSESATPGWKRVVISLVSGNKIVVDEEATAATPLFNYARLLAGKDDR
jgi:hypothetical protein